MSEQLVANSNYKLTLVTGPEGMRQSTLETALRLKLQEHSWVTWQFVAYQDSDAVLIFELPKRHQIQKPPEAFAFTWISIN